ncbi:hypothetical protein VULLAG_LOCUS971 [Vulpes lagopus]
MCYGNDGSLAPAPPWGPPPAPPTVGARSLTVPLPEYMPSLKSEVSGITQPSSTFTAGDTEAQLGGPGHTKCLGFCGAAPAPQPPGFLAPTLRVGGGHSSRGQEPTPPALSALNYPHPFCVI